MTGRCHRLQSSFVPIRSLDALWRRVNVANCVGSDTHPSLGRSPAGLAATLGVGMASEAFRRSSSRSGGSSQSLLMSEANLERLVAKLSKMRGAALKLGQFLSIQG